MTTATVRPAPIRRNADQWSTLLLRFEQSSLSPEDFCRREHLALSSFHRWRRRLAPTTSTPGFVELLPPTVKFRQKVATRFRAIGSHFRPPFRPCSCPVV